MKKSTWKIKKIVAFIIAFSILFGSVNTGVRADELGEEVQTEVKEESTSDNQKEESGDNSEGSSDSEGSLQVEVPSTEEVSLVSDIVSEEETVLVTNPEEEEAAPVLETETQTKTQTKTASPANEEDSSTAKKVEKKAGEGEDPDGEDPEPIIPIYTIDDVSVTSITGPDQANDGAQNGYKFEFNLNSDGAARFSAYVYGNGVDEDICQQLAAAYFNGLYNTMENSTVTSPDLTDAEKSSVDHDYNTGYDSNLCWAYSASNALWQTDWMKNADAGIFNIGDSASGYFSTVDDLSSYAAYCFKDVGGDEKEFWRWIFTGQLSNPSKLICGLDEDDALLKSYYTDGLFEKESFDTTSGIDFMNEIFSQIENGDVGATIGVYGENDGHAMTLTGFIKDSEGNPVAVILANSDNGVGDETQPDDPYLKDNTYSVHPIKYLDGDGWYFSFDTERPEDFSHVNKNIGDISILQDSEGKEKVNASYTPESSRAISDSFDNDLEYDLDSDYGFNIPLNIDFLSFYDISKLKYKLLGEDDEVIEESSITKSKSEWKQMIADGISSITLSFRGALSNLTDGKYKVEVEVDQDCFTGNYGWFAQRYDNNNGYFDRLVSTFVNLFRGKTDPVPAPSEDYEKKTTHHKKDTTVREVNAQENTEAPAAEEKSEMRRVVNDLAKAIISDPASVAMFKTIGIDANKINIENLNLVMSTPITMNKAGTVRFSAKGLRFTPGDTVFALIYLSDGTTRYIKGNILADGSIEFSVPVNIVAITVFSI